MKIIFAYRKIHVFIFQQHSKAKKSKCFWPTDRNYVAHNIIIETDNHIVETHLLQHNYLTGRNFGKI